MGGAQQRARITAPQKPGRQCRSRRKARRQALQNKMGAFKNVGAILVLKMGQVELGLESVPWISLMSMREWFQKSSARQSQE